MIPLWLGVLITVVFGMVLGAFVTFVSIARALKRAAVQFVIDNSETMRHVE